MKTIYIDSDFKCHLASDGTITFTYFEEKLATAIPIQIEVYV